MLLLAALLTAAAPAPPDADREVRMKTTRQLKAVLTAVDVPFSESASKSELRALALKHNALAKYEALHPEKKKSKPARPSGASSESAEQAAQFFSLMDADGNGRVSEREMRDSGVFGPDASAETIEQGFAGMDADGSGSVSQLELARFLELMSQQRDAYDYGSAYDYGAPVDLSHSRNVEGPDTIDYALDDDDYSELVDGLGPSDEL